LIYHPFTSAANIPLAAVLAASVFAASVFPIRLTPKTKVYLTAAPILGLTLLYAPATAVIVTVIGTAAAQPLQKKANWITRIFNTSQTALFAAAAGLVYRSMASLFGMPALASGYGMLCAVSAMAAMYLVNSSAVSTAAALRLRKNPCAIWMQGTRASLPTETAQYGVGLVGAMLASQTPWAIALIIMPVIVVYYMFKKSASLSEKIEHQLVELEATQAQLVETARMASIGTMVAGTAHQINNPMFVIRGRAETLCQDADENLKTPAARKAVQVIYDMADRVSRIVNSLLPDSCIGDDGVHCCDVNEVVRNTLLLLEPKLLKSQIEVSSALTENLPLCLGDACEIQELLINLVDNACNAMPSGGKLSITTRDSGPNIAIRVSDTGVGITDENLRHIFSPFFTTRKGSGGVGLGLYVSKHIAEKYGGKIEVDSHAGAGTVFTISLGVRQLKAGQINRRGTTVAASGSDSRHRG
jgi:C4-dicarboxylate-specific signal transduction histidine kinase